MSNAILLTAAPISVVRIGIVGLGRRGMRAMRRLVKIEGAEVRAVADLSPAACAEAESELAAVGLDAAAYSGENAWQEICRRSDIDLVYICTDWRSHAAMACHTMTCGKHVALEVPAAESVADCMKLVETAETTRRHCALLENCCYDRFALTTMRLAREGMLGTITHAEGAYVHDLDFTPGNPAPTKGAYNGWEVKAYHSHTGNPYPTHGLGPICLTMDIHRGDRMETLVSLSSDAAGEGHAKINTSIIKTHLGRTIVLGHDVSTPRPYSREMITCGTRGFTRKYPRECIMFAGESADDAYSATPERVEQFLHPVSARWGKAAVALEGDNEMNYVMDMRLIYCLRSGLPLDIDVYDAAEWSAVAELSAASVRAGGMPVTFPDFTRGAWKDAAPHEFFI